MYAVAWSSHVLPSGQLCLSGCWGASVQITGSFLSFPGLSFGSLCWEWCPPSSPTPTSRSSIPRRHILLRGTWREPYAFAEPNLISVVARSKAGGARSASNAHCQTLYELCGAAKDSRHADNLSVMAWRWCSTGLTKMLNFSSSCRRIRTRCVRCNAWL